MIDFTFTEEQDMFRTASREFAETVVAPRVQEMEETGKVCDAVVKGLAEAEMMAITIPEEFGGLGLGYTARLIALEEISRISVATAMMLQVFHLGIEPIVKFGTQEQKEKYLPKLASGEMLATASVTEPTGGSDPAGGRTVYTQEDDTFVINGRKCFITNSHIADVMTVLAKSDEDPKAFCAFIVEKDMEGYKATREEHKVGMRGCNTGEQAFKNLRVPKENVLGEVGKGIRVVMSAIGDVGRGGMVGCALGTQTACLEASIKFANERILYGKPIMKLQGIQNKIAEMKIDLEAGRLLGYRAAAMHDNGKRCDNEFAAAKYYTTEAAQKAAKMACDIHGGYGCMEEFAVTRYLRDSFVLGPSAGTSDIMKVIVARWAIS
ncbi:MAG: acyl-CoA dehydrogenase [Deltaproteobacteria bacterium]|jgi:alkylation response protein AidB-like acyl-CoA dehydrogenase|nr:acyl-CoA dehydrogenase [Deltaproteobacteria bacterium]MBT4638465.1 acyl-CoA dehydrogenase [Deltaproteobacteria bacterium]MBT7153845.1 acyl-CoA dehydrogenase [Deltaproteobacteria bacterium]MBT7714301.1 acyl-CoA dehydrogenase [Deltaproteobacteria bacterium]MBT7888498.1 acyl-CoA dehydrogenase [Deltaproteobacteria bacterium]